MKRLATILVFIGSALPAAVVIDRISIVVGNHAIKLSDIQRETRMTEFMNGQPLDVGTAAMRQAGDRLIDQAIIRKEVAEGDYRRPGEVDVDKLITQLRHDRFGGSDGRMQQELARYGLTEDQLWQQLLWQLTVLRFIDERFRPGIQVTDDEVHSYYNQHAAELQRAYPTDHSFETVEAKVRDQIQGERVNQAFVAWLDEARKQTQITYKQEELK